MTSVFNSFVRASEIQQGELVAYENSLWVVESRVYEPATGDRTINPVDAGGRKSEIKYWADYDPCVTRVRVFESQQKTDRRPLATVLGNWADRHRVARPAQSS